MVAWDNYATEFKRQVDPNCSYSGDIKGEDGIVGKQYYNKTSNVTYLGSVIREVYRDFAREFQLPPNTGAGISINETEMFQALEIENSWIIVCMPKDDEMKVNFYGLEAATWYNYCTRNHTIRTPAGRYTANYSVPIKMLKNMKGFATGVK